MPNKLFIHNKKGNFPTCKSLLSVAPPSRSPVNMALKAAIMQNLILHRGMVRTHLFQPELATARRVALDHLARHLLNHHPNISTKKSHERNLTILVPNLDYLSSSAFDG